MNFFLKNFFGKGNSNRCSCLPKKQDNVPSKKEKEKRKRKTPCNPLRPITIRDPTTCFTEDIDYTSKFKDTVYVPYISAIDTIKYKYISKIKYMSAS